MKPQTIAQYKAALAESESERMNLARECSTLARENVRLELRDHKLTLDSNYYMGQVKGLETALEIITRDKSE